MHLLMILAGASLLCVAAHAATLQLSEKYNFRSIHVTNGSNTLSELIPEAPAGLLVFKYDNAKGWSAAQFSASRWAPGDFQLLPDEGALFINPTDVPVTVQVVGQEVPPQETRIYQGLNLVGGRRAQQLAGAIGNPGDAFYRFQSTFFRAYMWDELENLWTPATPVFPADEAVFVRAGSDWPVNSAGTMPSSIPVYVNNRASALGFTSRVFDPTGCGMSDPRLRAQLYLSSNGVDTPVGEPFGFGSGVFAGYFDPEANLVRHLPRGSFANVFIEVTDPERSFVMRTTQTTVSGFEFIPVALNGLTFPQPLATLTVQVESSAVAVAAGGTATLRGAATAPGSQTPVTSFFGHPVTFRWERQVGVDWQPVAGATSNTLTLEQTRTSDAGTYRLKAEFGCATSTSGAITLSVTETPANAVVLSIYNAVEVRFDTTSGKRYQLQSSQDLATWTDQGSPILGTGQPMSRLISTRDSGRSSYRVQTLE